MNNRKIYICGITSAGQEQNLREMLKPCLEHVNGIQFTFHNPSDEGADYLESVKGSGTVVYANFCKRHGYSMTHYLWQGTMKDGDIFIQLDSTERLTTQFFYEKLPQFIALMDEADVACISNFGKGLIFRYNEQLEFRGSPHWYVTGLDGRHIDVQLEQKYFYNVRAEQRDKFHFVRHYAKYMLYPAGSNHALLGLDTIYKEQQQIVDAFRKREEMRLAFISWLKANGYPVTVDGVIEAFKKLDEGVKPFINSDKVWNDLYRYEIQGDTTVIDNHDHSKMIKL